MSCEREAHHRWSNAHEWLADRITPLAIRHDVETLAQDFRQLADACTEDQIQDLFQPDMARDGYFRAEGRDGDQEAETGDEEDAEEEDAGETGSA